MNYSLDIDVEGYTIKDIVLLINILMIRHRLSCTLHSVKNKQCISINSKSIPLLFRGIRPFFSDQPPMQQYLRQDLALVSLVVGYILQVLLLSTQSCLMKMLM